MSDDPLIRLAHLRIIRAGDDLERQLADKRGGAPTIEILRRLYDCAAESLAALAIVDAEDPHAIRALQNEVKKYDEFVAWMRTIISEGRAYDRQMSEDEREEMIDILVATPEGQREAAELGLVELNQHNDG